MYDINLELSKIDSTMLRHKYDISATRELYQAVLDGIKRLNNEYQLLAKRLKEATLNKEVELAQSTAKDLDNIDQLKYYLSFRESLLKERVEKFKEVHTSRMDCFGQVLPWDTEETLAEWKRINWGK